jgi:serine/threonine protein kinase
MQHTLSEGTVFAARYQVLRLIAAGGMAAVYEVLHIETARRRALKVMLPHVLASADLRQRFQREAKIAAGIESEHLIEVFDAGFDEATEMPFLVMELLKGEDLGKRLKRAGRFTQDEVVTYLYQAALALEETHRASIVHRDLKPDNLFLAERRDGTSRIKVLDFGIAKVVAESATAAGATQALGTPLYMAPEQFGDARVSPASDIYALGMLAYTLLVGASYWKAEMSRSSNVFAFVSVVMFGPSEPAGARAARAGVALPAAFDDWFARTTAVLPEARFQSAIEAITALGQVLGVRASTPSGTSFGPAPSPLPPPLPVPFPSVPLPTLPFPLPSPPVEFDSATVDLGTVNTTAVITPSPWPVPTPASAPGQSPPEPSDSAGDVAASNEAPAGDDPAASSTPIEATATGLPEPIPGAEALGSSLGTDAFTESSALAPAPSPAPRRHLGRVVAGALAVVGVPAGTRESSRPSMPSLVERAADFALAGSTPQGTVAVRPRATTRFTALRAFLLTVVVGGVLGGAMLLALLRSRAQPSTQTAAEAPASVVTELALSAPVPALSAPAPALSAPAPPESPLLAETSPPAPAEGSASLARAASSATPDLPRFLRPKAEPPKAPKPEPPAQPAKTPVQAPEAEPPKAPKPEPPTQPAKTPVQASSRYTPD